MRPYRITLLFITSSILVACASLNPGNPDMLPEKSRATPELALLNKEAQLADIGGEAAKAEALYKAVLRQTPNDTETWYRLGNLYANNNHPAEAAIAYERTLVSDNNHVRAWHNLAIIRLRQSYAAMLQASIVVDPQDPLAPRIDHALDEYSNISFLETQAKSGKMVKPSQTTTVTQPLIDTPLKSPVTDPLAPAGSKE